MNGTSFTAVEVIDILKACRDTDVAEFEGGGIRVVRGRTAPKGAWDFSNPVAATPAPAPTVPIQAEPDHEAQNKEALAIDELRLKEEQIAEMLITDPLYAEELIAKGDLVENESETA